MIYKSKFKFYRIDISDDILYKYKDVGYKIKIKKYIFYVNKWFSVFEESTGRKVTLPKKMDSLEEIECYLESIYDKIEKTMANQISSLSVAQETTEEEFYKYIKK